MSTYYVHSDRTPGRVRCQCGERKFTTPEPPTDPFYSGRFVCTGCAFVWDTANIVQNLTFKAVA